MSIEKLANEFWGIIEKEIGPFDKPFQFRVFPFSAGGNLNLLTKGRGDSVTTYVSWDLFGHPDQMRGSIGRYELTATCDNEEWSTDMLTYVGRFGLHELLLPGETMDISQLVGPNAALKGIIFELAFSTVIGNGLGNERASLLRCIGVTNHELEYAMTHGVDALIIRLKETGVYPKTLVNRSSVYP